VLAVEADQAAVGLEDGSMPNLEGALAVVVDDVRAGLVDDAPAGPAKAVAEIDIVEVEGEVLVEEPDLVESGSADRERGGHGLIDVAAGAVVPVGHAVAAEGGTAGEDAGEAEGVVEDGGGFGEAAAGRLNGAVGEEELGRDCARSLLLGEGFEKGGERARLDLGVGVEEKHEGSASGGDCLVVAGGEADIAVVGDEMDGRELGLDHLDGAVCGGVVHDGDVGDLGTVAERMEAGPKEVARAPGDDADVELCGDRS